MEIAIMTSDLLPPGQYVLWQGRDVVWTGKVGGMLPPIWFDGLTLTSADAARLDRAITAHNRKHSAVCAWLAGETPTPHLH